MFTSFRFHFSFCLKVVMFRLDLTLFIIWLHIFGDKLKKLVVALHMKVMF